MKKRKQGVETAAAFTGNALVYGLNGIYAALPIYLHLIGFTDVQSGYLLAINPLIMCFSPVIWGRILDRCRSKNIIMATLIGCAAAAYLGIRLQSSFYWIAVMLLLYSFFQAPFNAVMDTLTVYFAEQTGRNYGAFRVMGTVGYGLLALLVTLYADASAAFILYGVVAALAVVSVLLMRKTPGCGGQGSAPGSLGGFFLSLHREAVLLVAVMAVTQFVWGFYANFYPTYLTDTLHCAGSVWGWFSLVTAYAEIPFFVLYTKLFRRVNAKVILQTSLAAMALRFAGLLLLTDLRAVFVLGFLTGTFITVVNYCVTLYIMHAAEREYLSLTQNFSYAAGWGLPRILAGCVGGYLMQYLGFRLSMILCAALLLLTLLLLVFQRKTVSAAAEKIRIPE